MLYIKKEIDFNDLKKILWNGALDTLKTIENNNKEDEFMDLLIEIYDYNIPNDTELNDFVSFEDDYIFETLDINIED